MSSYYGDVGIGHSFDGVAAALDAPAIFSVAWPLTA